MCEVVSMCVRVWEWQKKRNKNFWYKYRNTGDELDIGAARRVYTIKSVAKFQASMFAGVAPELV